jgi:hypothetical protein
LLFSGLIAKGVHGFVLFFSPGIALSKWTTNKVEPYPFFSPGVAEFGLLAALVSCGRL